MNAAVTEKLSNLEWVGQQMRAKTANYEASTMSTGEKAPTWEERCGAIASIEDQATKAYCEMLVWGDSRDTTQAFKILVENIGQVLYEAEIKDVKRFTELAKAWILASKHQSIFIKPVDGKGGANAYRLDHNSHEAEFNAVFNAIITAHYIIQETIIQHPDIQMVSPYSINTLRVDTYKPLNEPSRVMSALMRFGRKGFVVDNPGSSGGFFVPVDMQNKCLKAPGLQMMAVGNHTYLEHPDTHVVLDKHSIPYLEEAFALVNHACELLGDRLIGWDVCIGPEGPIIIEGNHNYHMVMQEVAYGGYRKHPDFIRVLAEENIRP